MVEEEDSLVEGDPLEEEYQEEEDNLPSNHNKLKTQFLTTQMSKSWEASPTSSWETAHLPKIS